MKKLLLFSLIFISFFAHANTILDTVPTDRQYNALLFNVHKLPDNKKTIWTIDVLLNHPRGFDTNAKDSLGRTAIWLAALGGKNNIYNHLLARGANPDIKSTNGEWAGLSARELNEMSPEEIEATRNIGTKEKLP